ncbi:hypothetical protein [Microbacterium sp. A84]|uniref:hypothetical protein n=1 Tax=Microbacterium sp. A84 TaxID=3450715 RepID=UPI003F42FBCD
MPALDLGRMIVVARVELPARFNVEGMLATPTTANDVDDAVAPKRNPAGSQSVEYLPSAEGSCEYCALVTLKKQTIGCSRARTS